jgi:hypothetical protein
MAHRVGAINIGALNTRNFRPHHPEEDDGEKPGPTGTLCYEGRAAVRREQLESKRLENRAMGRKVRPIAVESKHHKNRATGRKVRPITDITSTALGKEEMAICL